MAFLGSTIQQMAANKLSQPYYRFDVDDDYITVADNAALDMNAELSIVIMMRPEITSANAIWQSVVTKRSSGTNYELFITGSGGNAGKLGYYNDVDGVKYFSKIPTVNEWVHVVLTVVEATSVANLYVDGVLEGTVTAGLGAVNSANLGIGAITDASQEFKGEISGLKIYNVALDADEVKELYSGGSVPFKYKGANQTELIAAQVDRDFSGASAWSNAGSNTYDESGDLTLGSTATYQGATLPAANAPMVVGKRYRLKFTTSALSGDGFVIRNYDQAYIDGLANIPVSSGANSYEFTYNPVAGSSLGGGFKIIAVDTGGITFDDFSLVQIGAVAEYDGSGATDATWWDKSGNNLDGTVTGASLENKLTALDVTDNSTFGGTLTVDGEITTSGNTMTLNGIQSSSRTGIYMRNYQGGTRITFGAGSGGFLDDRARIDGDYGAGGDGGDLTFSVKEIASQGGDVREVLTLDRDRKAIFAGNIDISAGKFEGNVTIDGKGIIKYGTTSAWAANTGNSGVNDYLQLHQDSGTTGTGVGYLSAMRFSVATGATESTGYLSYVRTADYQGKLVFTQRTAVSTYVDSLIIDSSSNATFYGNIYAGNSIITGDQSDFDTITGWATDGNGTITSVSGGQSGNCMQNVQSSGSGNTDIGLLTVTGLTIGKYYKWSAYVKQGTQAGSTVKLKVYNDAQTEIIAETAAVTTASWVQHSVIWKATEATPDLIFGTLLTNTESVFIDTVTLHELHSFLPQNPTFDGTIAGTTATFAHPSGAGHLYIEGGGSDPNVSLHLNDENSARLWEFRSDGGESDALQIIDTGGAVVLKLEQDSNATFAGHIGFAGSTAETNRMINGVKSLSGGFIGILENTHVDGYGLYIAGASGTNRAFNVRDYNSGNDLFYVQGSGNAFHYGHLQVNGATSNEPLAVVGTIRHKKNAGDSLESMAIWNQGGATGRTDFFSYGKDSSTLGGFSFYGTSGTGTGDTKFLELAAGTGTATFGVRADFEANATVNVTSVGDTFPHSAGGFEGMYIEGGSHNAAINNYSTVLKLSPDDPNNRTANYYSSGIGFMHLHPDTWNSSYYGMQAWIGLKLHSTPGQELSHFVIATNSSSSTNSMPVERFIIHRDAASLTLGGGNATFAGTVSQTGVHDIKQAALYQGVKATGHDNSYYGYFGMGDAGYTTLLAAGDRGMDFRVDSQFRWFTLQNSTAVQRMTLSTGGNLLVQGTNTAGNFTSGVVEFDNVGSSGDGCTLVVSTTVTDGHTDRGPFQVHHEGNGHHYIKTTNDGHIYRYPSTTTTWDDSSDVRIKKNVVNLKGEGLSIVNQLRPVKFDYTDDFIEAENLEPRLQQSYGGFIANEVREVLPDIVTEGTKEVGGETWNDFLSMNETCFNSIMMASIQELSDKVDALEISNAELKAQVSGSS